MYRDRGMGRVSLTGYHQGLLKVKLEFNGRLSSVVSWWRMFLSIMTYALVAHGLYITI